MIRLSVNVLTSALTLFERIETYHFSSLSELSYSKISSISAEDIFTFSYICGWVYEEENPPVLTERGNELLQMNKQGLLIELKRQMLTDYVLKTAPIWSSRIPYGRREAAIFMSKDERACFSEAGLLSCRLESGIIDWWDSIAQRIRDREQQTKSNIGRIGERNTVVYEKIRTDAEPMWISVDSNLAGYDIKSKVEKDNSAPLLIEVKTTTHSLNRAAFYITSHEWNVALTSSYYVFHLWCLAGGKKLLAVVSPADVLPYIPSNNLEGQWERARIPFSCFESKFIEIA